MTHLFPLDLPVIGSGTIRGHVPEALARRVAPLFGLDADEAPHQRSWACDYDYVTLKELGRGAPVNNSRSSGSTGLSDSDLGERELSSATLSLFGPDTKAAVILVAANRQFSSYSDDLNAVLEHVIATSDSLEPADRARLAILVWATGIIGLYRSYPALMIAALKARLHQRAARTSNVIVAESIADRVARSEFGYRSRPEFGAAFSPDHLDVLDVTLESIWPIVATTLVEGSENPDVGEPEALRSAQEALADLLQSDLLRLGDLNDQEPVALWVAEDRLGFRTVDVHLQIVRILSAFLTQFSELLGRGLAGGQVDDAQIVSDETFEGLTALSVGAQRICLHGLSVAARWYRDDHVRLGVSKRLQAANAVLVKLQEASSTSLEEADIIALDIRVSMTNALLRDSTGDVVQLIEQLVGALDALQDQLQSDRAPAGFGLEVLARGCVVLNLVRRRLHVRTSLSATVRDHVFHRLNSYWATFTAGVFSPERLPKGASTLGYHLHSYAGFKGTAEIPDGMDNRAELSESVDLVRSYVLPSRQVVAERTQRDDQLRLALQVGSGTLARLAVKECDMFGSTENVRRTATEASEYASRALQTNDATSVIGREKTLSVDSLRPLIQNCLRGFTTGHELAGVTPSASDLEALDTLVTLFEEQSGVRHSELRTELLALR